MKTLDFTAFFEKKIIAFPGISYYNVVYKLIGRVGATGYEQRLRGI